MRQPRRYDLNPNDARESGRGGGNYISESGGYEGVITRAMEFVNRNGTEGVELSFRARDGREIRRIEIYTYNASGDSLPGNKTISALLACLKLRTVEPQQARGMVYDFDAGRDMERDITIYPKLMNVPVGLVLQREEYLNSREELKYRMNLLLPFTADTRQTAAEVLDQKPAESLERILANIKDKKVDAPPQRQHGGGYPPANQPHHRPTQQPGPMDDFDDDIPF